MDVERVIQGFTMLTTICRQYFMLSINLSETTRRRVQRRQRIFRRHMHRLQNNIYENLVRFNDLFDNIMQPIILRPVRHRRPNKIRSSDWWERIVQNHFTDDDWIANFRMRRESFEHLCEMLSESLSPDPKSLQVALDVRKKVALTLYKLASCAEYRVVGNQFGVHKSTVQQTLYAVIRAINSVIMPTLITMPDEDEASEIAFIVEENYKMPQAFLFIDGTHIPVLPPSEGYRDFINRKGWASLVLQGAVDNRYRFRDVSCIKPGCTHDAAVLADSSLFRNAEVLIPKKPQMINNVMVPVMVIGDAAYPLLDWLLKGYTGNVTPEQESFNVYLSSARMAVEIAFGRLKARWRCLLKRIDIHYKFVPHVVLACCTLHNFVENSKEMFIEQWLDDVRDAEILFPQPAVERPRMPDNYGMAQIRDHLCQHMANTLPLRQSRFQFHR